MRRAARWRHAGPVLSPCPAGGLALTRPRILCLCLRPAAGLVWLAGLAACGQPAPPYGAPVPSPATPALASGTAPSAGTGRVPDAVETSPFARTPFPPPVPSAARQPATGIDNSATERAIGDLESRVDENRFGRLSDCRAAGGIFTVTGCLR